jgi:hypothetical protein
MESRSRMVRCMLKPCTQLCLIVFVVGPVRDEILFGCMHDGSFECMAHEHTMGTSRRPASRGKWESRRQSYAGVDGR